VNKIKLTPKQFSLVLDILFKMEEYYKLLLKQKEIEEIPKMPEIKNKELYVFNVETVKEMIERTIWEETLYDYHINTLNSLEKKLIKAMKFTPNSIKFIKSL